MNKVLGFAFIAFIATLPVGHAAAQDSYPAVHPELTDMFRLEAGMHFPSVRTTAYLHGSGTLGHGSHGREVSFENALSLEKHKNMGMFMAGVRLARRWKIEMEYFKLYRHSERTLSESIDWGDFHYHIGTDVLSEFDSQTLRFASGYSVIHGEQGELTITLGLHTTDFTTSIEAIGQLASTEQSQGEVLAPLPTIGLYGSYAMTPKWMLAARIDVFSLDYESYEGQVTDATVKLDWRAFRHVGFGLGYRYLDYDLKVEKSRFTGGIEYRFTGPVVYINGSF